MSSILLPPEIIDRIFDFFPAERQRALSTVFLGWHLRVAWKAVLSLSHLATRYGGDTGELNTSQRRFRNFSISALRTQEDYDPLQKLARYCAEKYTVHKFCFEFVTRERFQQFVEEFGEWLKTTKILELQMDDNQILPSSSLAAFKDVQHLQLLNISDPEADWNTAWKGMQYLRSLTVHISWHYNDSALERLIESICEDCRSLKALTIRSTNCASVAPLGRSTLQLEKLSLVGLMVPIERSIVSFPTLRELHLDLEWFHLDETYMVIDAPKLDYLRIAKRNIPFIHFSTETKFTRLTTYGHSMFVPHMWFMGVQEVKTTIQEPPNEDAILSELQLFPRMVKLAIKIMSKECTTQVPCATTFLNINSLYLNNFILSMEFFDQIAELKLLERFMIEECNFFLDVHNTPQLDLAHLCHFRVKRVSMPKTVTVFPVTSSQQPPVILVDRLRTHLWRDDYYNVFSSQWE